MLVTEYGMIVAEPLENYGAMNISEGYGAINVTLPPEIGQMYLKRGSQGDEVKALQQALMAVGYDLPRYGADGKFGRETENALKRFQSDHGLPVTGVADPLTIAKLNELLQTKAKTKEPWLLSFLKKTIDYLLWKWGYRPTPTVPPVIVVPPTQPATPPTPPPTPAPQPVAPKKESVLSKVLPFVIIAGGLFMVAMALRRGGREE